MPETFVDRSVDLKELENNVRNKFKWSWLECKDANGDFLSDYVRKIPQPGMCFCLICNSRLLYGNKGKAIILRHAASAAHFKKRQTIKTNQLLPAQIRAHARLEKGENVDAPVPTRPYGAAPNVPEALPVQSSVTKDLPRPPNFKDRVYHQEAMICSFIAEHSLPLSIAPHLIGLAQTLAQDHKALQSLSMERQTATYKLKHGLHEVERKRLRDKMRSQSFSLNIDESTTKHGKKKVLNVLICFYHDTNETSVTYLYFSKEMTIVNAQTVYDAVKSKFLEDNVPFSNLISVLSDSAAYMRGCKNGFIVKLLQDAPHLLDIDGDVCHHIHNISKNFYTSLDEENLLPKLMDDVHSDMSNCADLREALSKMCTVLAIKNLQPKERAGHRWMSLYDCCERFQAIEPALILFYYSWLSSNDKELYKDFVMKIFNDFKVKAADRQKVFEMMRKLKVKNVTSFGKMRKQRICSKMFDGSRKIAFLVSIVSSIFPKFKSFILAFEQKAPMIHKLYDQQVSIFRNFLTFFVRPEFIRESGKQLSCLDLTAGDHIFLNVKHIFLGKCVPILDKMPPSDSMKYRQLLLDAYKQAAVYMQKKLPLSNPRIRTLSLLDPKAFGQAETGMLLKSLQQYLPTVQAPNFAEEIMLMQSDQDLSPSDSCQLDVWWASVFRLRRYPDVKKIVSACLSIFTGPRVEQSFSMMNHIIKENSSSLDISTYEAIQFLKYHLLASNKTTLTLFRRPDPIYSPVDISLAYHMQSAALRTKKRKGDLLDSPAAKTKRK